MCDNCRKGLEVTEVDRSKEGLVVMKLVQECEKYNAKVTAKMVTELLRGKKPKKNILRADLMNEYSGRLRSTKESDINRLIVQMLIMRLLKERFETLTIRGTSVKKVTVFLQTSSRKDSI